MAEQLGEAVLTVSADTRQLEAGLQRARQQGEEAGGKLSRAFEGFGNTLRNLAGLAGVVGIGALVQQIAQAGQESERSKIQLAALAGAYGEATDAAAAAARIQAVLGVSSLEARQNFSQLYAALRGTGIGLAQLEVLFVGLSKAAQLSGASTAEASGALLQLRQGLASGVLQGDELRSVLENLPAFAQAVAKEMGVNVGQLRKLGSEGKITSQIVFNAAKSLASATTPGRTQVEQLGIAFTNLKEQVAAAFGPAVLEVIRNVTGGIALFTQYVKDNQKPLGLLVQSLVGMTKAILPLIISITLIRGAMQAWALASKAAAVAQAAVLALQGPAGWAILATGIGLAAGAAKLLESALKGIGDAGKNAKGAAAEAIAAFNAALKGTNLPTPTGTPAPTAAELEKQRQRQRLQVSEAEAAGLKLSITRQQIALELQALNTGGQLSDTAKQRLQIQESIAAALRQQKAAQDALDAELGKPAATRSSAAVDELLGKVASANADVRQAYADAGLSLVQNARSAADALRGAQDSFNSTARGGFQFLTPQLQQDQLRAARASVQGAIDRGLIRTGIDISSPEKLFQVAAFAEQIVPAQKRLEDALTENTKATALLTKKDWNIYLNGQTVKPPTAPVVSPEPVTFGPPRRPEAMAYGVFGGF